MRIEPCKIELTVAALVLACLGGRGFRLGIGRDTVPVHIGSVTRQVTASSITGRT